MIVDGNPVHMSFFLCGEHVGTNKFQTYAQDPQGADLFFGGMASHILAEPSMGMSPTPKNDGVNQQPV